MKAVIIFLYGAAFGIVALLGGLWLWFQISLWLPYQRPDPQLVEQIERQAKDTQPSIGPADMPGGVAGQKYLDLSKYSRWYVQAEDDKGQKIVLGSWQLASNKSPPGVRLGHRRFPPDFNIALGGGCGWVHLTYKVAKSVLEDFSCNAPE